MKRVLKVLLLIALVGVFLWFYKSRIIAPGTAVVYMTDSGFVPSSLRITQGETVTFINKGSKPHWVASNPHPVHSIYPAFDPKTPIYPGQSWQFKFDQMGIFPFHDHLDPQFGGEIRVTLATQPGKIAFSYPLPENTALFNQIKQIEATEGAKLAWNFLVVNYSPLDNAQGNQPDDISFHSIAHYLGIHIYDQEGLNGLRDCNSSFGFGCFHGAVEELINKTGPTGFNDAVSLCESLPIHNDAHSCIHGIGHSLVTTFGYDYNKALQFCDQHVPQSSRTYCYNGIFMEIALTRGEFSSNDYEWPCNLVDKSYKESCYSNIAVAFRYSFHQSDPYKIAAFCNSIKENIYSLSCISGLADDLSIVYADSPDKLLSLCNSFPGNSKYSCKKEAARKFYTISYSREAYLTSKNNFCGSLPEDWKNQCDNLIDRYYTNQD